MTVKKINSLNLNMKTEKRGRPKSKGSRLKTYSIKLSDDEIKELKKIAKANNKKPSVFVRDLLLKTLSLPND